MDEKYREPREEDRNHDASDSRNSDRREDAERQRKMYDRPALTRREQQERWPIG